MFRKLIENGWKIDQVRALTVGQWFGIMQKDGPGGEEVNEMSSDPDDFTRWRNERRAKKGLPPLELPSAKAKREKEQTGMTNEQIEKLGSGARVSTPHGAGAVVERNAEHDGWMVRRDGDGLLAFYHAWDLHPKAEKKAQTPAPSA